MELFNFVKVFNFTAKWKRAIRHKTAKLHTFPRSQVCNFANKKIGSLTYATPRWLPIKVVEGASKDPASNGSAEHRNRSRNTGQ